jgi:signal transduction histidine kinase
MLSLNHQGSLDQKTPSRAVTQASHPLTLVTLVLALAAVYFGAAKLGLALAFQAEQVTAVWPPTGIALAAFLLLGYRVWPGIFLGALLANVTSNEPLATACGIAVGNTVEGLVGAWLLHRIVGFRASLERLRDVLGLVILAGAASTMLSATIGVTSLCLGGVQPWGTYGWLWWLWWLGDATGAVLVAPLLLAWATSPMHSLRSRRLEAVALLASLLLVSLVVFAGGVTPAISRHPLEYTMFPFVVWAALRFGQPGTTAVTFIASCVAIWGTVHGYGPFATGTTQQNLILLQAFMAVVAITALLLSAAMGERLRTEDDLRRNQEQAKLRLAELNTLLEILPTGVWIGNSDCSQITGNPAAYQMLGLPPGINASVTTAQPEMPQGLRIFAEGVEVRPEDAPMQQVARSGKALSNIEHELVFPDGTRKTVYASIAPVLGEDGQVRAVIGSYADFTDRKQAELALQEADRRKTEFLATLAHELRNPLAPISNALQLLQRAADRPDLQAQARGIIERQLRQMVRLVDDLLDVSRITRGRLQLHKEPMDLAAAIQSALEATRPLIDDCGHQLTITLPPGPMPLDADPVRLAQIFTNLLHNAAKFTPRGGRIWLTAQRGSDEVMVSVRDTGVGIAAEHLPRLFTTFAQVSPALERSQGGLGIGLSLVRGLVELHGGRIEARSGGPGQGSEFQVRLPLAPRSMPVCPPAEEKAEPQALSPLRILVVDDNPDTATSLSLMLEVGGHDIRTAHDGLEAVQAAAAFRPDVILLDIGLPGMNGYEVAAISASSPGAGTCSWLPSPAGDRRRTSAAPRKPGSIITSRNPWPRPRCRPCWRSPATSGRAWSLEDTREVLRRTEHGRDDIFISCTVLQGAYKAAQAGGIGRSAQKSPIKALHQILLIFPAGKKGGSYLAAAGSLSQDLGPGRLASCVRSPPQRVPIERR